MAIQMLPTVMEMDRQQKHRWMFTAVNLVLILLVVWVTNKVVPSATPKEVSYSEFLRELRADHLSEVEITERELIGVLKGESGPSKSRAELTITATRLPGVDEAALLKELESHPVKFTGHIEAKSWVWNLLGGLFPFVLIFLIYIFGMRRMMQGRGALTFGKNQAKIYDQASRTQVTFDDVAGVDEAKLERAELDDLLVAETAMSQLPVGADPLRQI